VDKLKQHVVRHFPTKHVDAEDCEPVHGLHVPRGVLFSLATYIVDSGLGVYVADSVP
jgi:hypothetical protein